jgi:hypothetical protein
VVRAECEIDAGPHHVQLIRQTNSHSYSLFEFSPGAARDGRRISSLEENNSPVERLQIR